MQGLTEDLLNHLAASLQAGVHGFRGRVEIDYVIPGFEELGEPQDLNLAYGTVSRDVARHGGDPGHYWVNPTLANDGNNSTYAHCSSGLGAFEDWIMSDLGAAYECTAFNIYSQNAWLNLDLFQWSSDGTTWNTISYVETGGRSTFPGGATLTFDAPITARYWAIRAKRTGFSATIALNRWEILGTASVEQEATIGTTSYQPIRIMRDFSRRMAAAQLTVVLPNETGALSIAPDSPIRTNAPIRTYQWYGDQANEVQTFAGLIDAIRESRDPRIITITARDRMKRLIVQTFGANAPQGIDEDGAVRTAANGVYLEAEISDIVSDILDRAGWPAATREITPTGYALDEYVLADGASWAESIIGENALTGLSGYEAGASTDGTFYFRPPFASKAPDADTAPTPDYSYVVGADAVVL